MRMLTNGMRPSCGQAVAFDPGGPWKRREPSPLRRRGPRRDGAARQRAGGCYAWVVADLVNEFSWSRTRDNVFKGAPRRSYYRYYGAGGGGGPGAAPLVRRLYVLKQLGTRQMWAGRLVHEAAERALLAMRDGPALSEAALIEDTGRQMRLAWRGAGGGRGPGDPH